MKKNVKVIQINGISGIIKALCIVACLIAGFVVFPGIVLMACWNHFIARFLTLPPLGILQGVLLWGIVVITYMIINKRQVMICFKNPTELSDDELDEVMDRIKYETTTKMMAEVLKSVKDEKNHNSPLISENSEDKESEDKDNKTVDN